MDPFRTDRAFRVAVGMSAAIAFLHLTWLAAEFGGPTATLVFDDLTSLLVPLAAAAACTVAAREEIGRLRTAWGLMGLACLSWALGQAVWTYYELVLGQDVPFPSLADVGYLGLIPFAVAATRFFSSTPPTRAGRLRTLLDGGIAAVFLLFVSWAIVLGPVYRASGGSLFEQVIGLAYPIGDVVIITAILAFSIRPQGIRRSTLFLMASGLLAIALADSAFAYLTTTEQYATGNLIDVGWSSGFLLIGVSALRPAGQATPESAGRDERRRAGFLLAYVPVLVALPIAIERQITEGSLEPILFWLAALGVALILARQALALADNLVLARRIDAGYRGLQDSEAKRTGALRAVSHELVNSLSPIKLELRVLEKLTKGSTERHRHSFEIANRHVEHIERLTSDLRDLTRLEAGRLALVRKPTDLGDVVRAAAQGHETTAQARGVRLTVEAAKMGPVVADAERLTQVLNNLLSNALKFTPKDGSVRVVCHNEGSEAVVEVHDSGRGLTPEEMGRLFRPFSQVHDPSEVRERGTGLGLFICKGIVEQHGGRVDVRSPGRGQGATFSFRLPLEGSSRR